jgi:signal transduction histidine kinase/phage shock protein PspC (stress-responsive transcriptional regulator)
MTASAAPARRLVRAADGRVLAGVAAGLADLTGLPVAAVRVAFVVLCAANGMGFAVYAVFWVFLPQAGGRTPRSDRRAQALLLGVVGVAVVAFAVFVPLGLIPGWTTTAPVLAAVAGVALVWQQADVAQRERWRKSATGSTGALVRLGLGALLLIGGLLGFLASRGQLAVARAGLLSTAVVVVGLVLLSSPWWFAMATDLRAERRERIRSQERAEVAAHVHDSVLQTLALIQKASAEPAEVQRLARSQERELRAWLYSARHASGTLEAALEAVGAEVEEAHRVPVEIVVVGTVDLDERVNALVAATREAVVNAARHSGAASVDVYAEAEPTLVSVFVRDRGCGFDPTAVPADRHGLSGSVEGRMARHGGTAVIRSAPGDGTEIRLELPLG